MIKELKVPNLTFKIKKHDYTDLDDSYGSTHREKQVINIQSKLTPELERITLLHEIFHAMELNTGIEYCKEHQIDQFAHNWFFVLKNNPELMRYLLE